MRRRVHEVCFATSSGEVKTRGGNFDVEGSTVVAVPSVIERSNSASLIERRLSVGLDVD